MPETDATVKTWLRSWPTATQHWSVGAIQGVWLRAQPALGQAAGPRLVTPGANLFRAQPDGMWIAIGPQGSRARYCDCIVIESCNSRGNLYDKRARYTARTQATLVDIGGAWLDQRVRRQNGGLVARRTLLGADVPEDGVQLGLRYLRVLYALPTDSNLYQSVRNQIALEAHEYTCPQRRLAHWPNPAFQQFLERLSPGLHYMI